MSGSSAGSAAQSRPALDLSPAPGAASLVRRVRGQAGLELRMTLSNGEQILLILVIPLAVLIGLSLSTFVRLGGVVGTAARAATVLPGVFTLAVLSTAFTSLAIQTGFERRYGVLKRLAATPLSRGQLLAGKALAVAVVEVVQLGLLVGVAVGLGWRPEAVDPLTTAALLLLGTACFAALGLLLAGILRAEATLAVANAVYLVLLLGGGIAVPLARLPEAAARWLRLLPSGALSDGLHRTMSGSGTPWGALLVLLLWTAGAAALVRRTFRWQ
jgi:ABC-2 type transport system permease protein